MLDSKSKFSLITLVSICIISELMVLQPVKISWSQPSSPNNTGQMSPSFPQLLSNCYINRGEYLTENADLDTIVTHSTVKTLVVERESYICRPEGSFPVKVEISVYITLRDNIETQAALERTFEAITCIKDLNGTLLECISEIPPKTLAAVRCPVQKSLASQSIVNTVVGLGNLSMLSKSIQANFDALVCRDSNGNQMLKNVIVITSTFENLSQNKTSNKYFESIICLKDLVNALVLACASEK